MTSTAPAEQNMMSHAQELRQALETVKQGDPQPQPQFSGSASRSPTDLPSQAGHPPAEISPPPADHPVAADESAKIASAEQDRCRHKAANHTQTRQLKSMHWTSDVASKEGGKESEEPGNPSDESWMRPELDMVRLKPGASVEVQCDGEWWDCEVQEINEEKNEVKVHYIGGTEDEDEWVSMDSSKMQLPPMIECVWAKVGQLPAWPSVVMDGSLRDVDCKKLKVFHLQQMAAYPVSRKATQAITPKSIPKRCSDESLIHAINVSKRAMQYGRLPESVLKTIEGLYAAANASSEAMNNASPYHGRGRPPRKAVSPTNSREARRQQAMRKLGLLPPLGEA